METTHEKLRSIIAKQLSIPLEAVNLGTTFSDIQSFDALDSVELFMEVEEAFNVTITDRDAELIETVRELQGQAEYLLKPS